MLRWRIAILVGTAIVLSYLDRLTLPWTLTEIKKDFDFSDQLKALFDSAFLISYGLMYLGGGRLLDYLGTRRGFFVVMLFWSFACMSQGFAANYGFAPIRGMAFALVMLVVSRFLLGGGEGGGFPAATRAFTWWLPARERGFAQGITHSFARLGGAITPPLVLVITTRFGWRTSFVALGAASLAWTALWLASFTDTPDAHPWMTDAELADIRDDGASHAAHGPTPWRAIVRRMWLVTVVDFCYGWSLWVFLTWLPSYLSDARGFALDRLAIMTTLPLLAGVVGDTLGGVLSDAIFRRTGNLRLARRTLLAGGLGGAFAFIVPAVITGSAMTAAYLLTAAFFFLELTNAVLWTLPLDIAGAHAGTAGGMMNTGFGVAGMISPVVFGMLIQRTGRYDLPLFLSAALLLVGAICSLRIDPTWRVEPVRSGDVKVRL